MIRQRASAPGNKERRSRQQQNQNILPQYYPYQQQQQLHPISQEPQDQTSLQPWDREEETTTWSTTTTNDSGDDLVDEELGGEPDLPTLQTAPSASLPVNSVPYPTAVATAIPTNPSYYRTLYFQIPDSKYREHHQQRVHHHHRKVILASSSSPSSPPISIYTGNGKTSKYRFLYFFSSPHAFARAVGWYSVVAMVFLLFVGVLIDSQPLYIRGVLPRATLDHPRALRKFKVMIPTGATRLDPAKHAFQAALAYFVTLCVSWMYGYHWIERAWARIRRRHYKDIPDHYYPDDIQKNNNHYRNSKDSNVLSRLADILSPICSSIGAESRRFGQSVCVRHSNQTLPWQGRCLAIILSCQNLLGALGDICFTAIRRAATSMRTTTKRTRTRRTSTTASTTVTSSSLTIPSGDATTTTTTANTTATQRKRRKNTATTSRNESQSPPHTGPSEMTATFSSAAGKHKHG